MKTLAVIGASYLQRPLVLKAKEMGLKVICFAWPEGAVCAELADRFYPVSIVEKEEILQICKTERVDGICTIASDVASPTVAYVAEKMGLPGTAYVSSLKANNKFMMRPPVSDAGIVCPKYMLVKESMNVLPASWEYPVIVKPCDRSGSLGVQKINDNKELCRCIDDALTYSFKHEAILEEYIEGREVSVEFISHSGTHYPLAITDKVTTGAPHFVELEHHQPADLSQDVYERIYSLTRNALDALGITEGASHTEYRITDKGEICIIELGARMGGDFIGSDLVQLSTGYDFVKGVIQVAMGEFELPVLTENKYSGVYFLCKETERLLPLFEESPGAGFFVRKEIMNKDLKKVACSGDRSGYILYQADKRIVL